MIPIVNLYYLLCYAWDRLDESETVDIGALPQQDLPNLLASVLIQGSKRLLRQGLNRVYLPRMEETQNPKGKICVSDSLKRGTIVRNALVCMTDELSHDVLHNRIIRTTISRLSKAAEVDDSLRHEMRLLDSHLTDVRLISLRSEDFARVQLHRNTAFYRFLLHICELVFFALLAHEGEDGYRFKEFVRDEHRMRKVFQDFVYNFYRIEQDEFAVSSERFRWDMSSANTTALSLMPQMSTDVSLESVSRKIVIECKFTPNVLQEYKGKLSMRSEHLYQLFAYLKNLEKRGGRNISAEGLLLYPTANHPVDLAFETHGHQIRVVTLDLQKGWAEIKHDLLALLNSRQHAFTGGLPQSNSSASAVH